jgi:predicted ATPase
MLAQAGGDLVTKDRLIKHVWPNVIVEENTLLVHISAIRKALGADRGLLKTISGRGYCLLGAWTRRESPEPAEPRGAERKASPSLRPFVTNAPWATSSLIGRHAAVRELRDFLSAHRIVTLTGTGGIGKTKLALAVSQAIFPTLAGDLVLVELAPLSNVKLVASAVASALGLKFEREAISAHAVARAIGDRKMLLVLDNCEHVIGGAAEVAETIVRGCARVSVLATSREALGVEGERVYRVPPLKVPAEHENDLEVALEHSAAQLLVARMKELASGFAPQQGDLSAIKAICRRLDGIPLAIEFAAARAVTLGLLEVSLHLDSLFSFLTGGRRTALPRHQTLRAALDWSHDLLPDSERRVLRRLAVFSGGFTAEALFAAMGDGRQGELATLDSISSLVAKSLVMLDESAPGGRWRLLDTIRAYAREKLDQAGEAEITVRRHAEFFRDFFASATLYSRAQPSEDGVAHYIREIDNVRTALDWAFSASGDEAVGIVLTAAYVPVWLHLSLMVECRQRVERAVAGLETDANLSPSLRVKVQVAFGMAEVGSSLAWSDSGSLSEALALAENLGDADAQLRALWRIWSFQYYRGDWRTGLAFAERFATIASRSGTSADALVGERLVGTAAHYIGDQRSARLHLERMLASYEAPSDQRHTFWFHHDQRIVTRAMLARVLCLQGHFDQARQNVYDSLNQALAKRHTLSLRYTLGWGVFPIALMTGDFAGAERSLEMFDDISETLLPFWTLMAQSMHGALLIKRGELAPGVELLGAVLDTFRSQNWTMCFPDMVGVLAEGLAALGREDEARATLDEAFERMDRGGARWCAPDLLRIKADLSVSAGSAEECFLRSIDVAREQGAGLWELQAATSLARLWAKHGRADEGRQILASVYDNLGQGLTYAPMRTARDLLDSLEF